MSRRRVAVYGEIDLNLIDGSAIWVRSICRVLDALGDVNVTLLLRRSIESNRQFLIEELKTSGSIDVIDPGKQGRLGASEAIDELERLDGGREPFDLVLLRGAAVLTEAAQRGAFGGRLWPYVMTGGGLSNETLRRLVPLSARVLCQTDVVADEIRVIAPDANGSLLVLPPMIPAVARPDERAGQTLSLVYSGKLAPEYCWLETVAAFEGLRRQRPDAELHVLGDKVHRPADDPSFHEVATRSLTDTPGLRWHGAVAHSDVHGLLARCDIALSVRDPTVEGSREISTKVLEYGAAGLPVVLTRAPVYERLLGADYPLFVDGPASAGRLLTGPALDPTVRRAAADVCHRASRAFTYPQVAARLAPHLPAAAEPTSTRKSPRIVIAGHDLKFLDPIRAAITAAGAEPIDDRWSNHNEHTARVSRAALAQADVVFCEWCLGNAVWYSRNIRQEQRLVVRLHRMEMRTDRPAAVETDNVNSIVFVSDHVLEEAVERFGWDRSRLLVIPNAVDCERLHRPKSSTARYTLALIGYVPLLKRLDRALDILEELRSHEQRFRMLVVGRPPSDFPWIVNRNEEVDAFRRSYRRVQESDTLRGHVDFLPFTTDLPSLLQDVGWIVSTSDVEGHQVTLAEGAASAAVPLILDRPGVRGQYPDRWVHNTVGDAAAAVLSLDDDRVVAEQTAAASHARAWSYDAIVPRWTQVLGLSD